MEKYDTVDFNLRGKVISDKNGNYTLETIIPGNE
jgi:protocatechuate 3,4-dioxygenase beta subunit